MYKYVKHLEYPVNVSKKDLKMAKLIITQVGGPSGELGAVLRYFMQRYTMPDEKGRALLNDIATEEMAHLEIVGSIVNQLLRDASIEEIKAAGLEKYYTDHGKGIYPVNASGVPFDASYISVTGNPLIDLSEDMAAEEKAKCVYENLIDLATDKAVINPLLFLRQREVIHFNRFKELYEYYKSKGYK